MSLHFITIFAILAVSITLSTCRTIQRRAISDNAALLSNNVVNERGSAFFYVPGNQLKSNEIGEAKHHFFFVVQPKRPKNPKGKRPKSASTLFKRPRLAVSDEVVLKSAESDMVKIAESDSSSHRSEAPSIQPTSNPIVY